MSHGRSFYEDLSISAKLRLLMAVVSIAAISATGASLIVAEWFMVRTRLASSVEATAALVAENTAPTLAFRSEVDAAHVLRGLRADRFIRAAYLFDASGELFATYRSPGHDGPVRMPPPSLANEPTHEFDAPNVVVWARVKSTDGRNLGVLCIERSQQQLYERIATFAALTLAVIFVIGALTLWVAQKLQHFYTRPLRELAATAERVTATKDYALRAQRMTNDEVGVLADAFNEMLAAVQASQAEAGELYRKVRTHASELEARVQQRTMELQGAYNELETFSYSVSHDLRAPLRSIAVYTEVLLEDEANCFTPEAMQHLRRVLAAVSRMNSLIDGLLDLARITKRELRFEPIDLTALARDIVQEVAAATVGRTVEVTLGKLTPCVGDPVLVRQVLLNLIGNAFKYTRERADARVTIGEQAGDSPRERVYFVRDNGAGFDPAHAGRLFRVFERMHDPKRFEGTGIGLATSKRIIERHGGRIWAEGEPERGATFYFTLPATAGR